MTKLIWFSDDDDPEYIRIVNDDDDGRPVKATEGTAEEFAEACDSWAENENMHDFVGTHKALAGLLFEKLGGKHARSVMREIAKRGGLHHIDDGETDGVVR